MCLSFPDLRMRIQYKVKDKRIQGQASETASPPPSSLSFLSPFLRLSPSSPTFSQEKTKKHQLALTLRRERVRVLCAWAFFHQCCTTFVFAATLVVPCGSVESHPRFVPRFVLQKIVLTFQVLSGFEV